MRRVGSAAVLALWMVMSFAPAVRAQEENVLRLAREAATTGQRPAALAMLADRLSAAPRDVDARLLYGLVLSWEGRYDEARGELQQVLVQAPDYMDARVALMNVEWWSGRSREARDAADLILAQDPGNAQARTVRERLDVADQPWSASVSYANDTFSGDRDPWNEVAIGLSRLTPIGSVIFRAHHAERFGFSDQVVDVEFYPRFRPGSYAFIGVGVAQDPVLYPTSRVAFDFYQGLGYGVEVSGGMRRLQFSSTTNIYVATLTKYRGAWMFTGKVFHVPREQGLDSTSYHGVVRRYFGGDGTSYVGAGYGHGFRHDEIRNTADLTTLNSDTVRGEFNRQLWGRIRVSLNGGLSRQERQFGDPVWQTSVRSEFSVQF